VEGWVITSTRARGLPSNTRLPKLQKVQRKHDWQIIYPKKFSSESMRFSDENVTLADENVHKLYPTHSQHSRTEPVSVPKIVQKRMFRIRDRCKGRRA
jgi:hypothetical protein